MDHPLELEPQVSGATGSAARVKGAGRASAAGHGGGAGSLAVALGANLGEPAATLIAVRPLLEAVLQQWLGAPLRCHWSPLFVTAAVGGPPDQPDYLNAAVVVEPWMPSSLPDPRRLLEQLQILEQRFGRVRRQRWGPRSLDLDLLWCGDQVRRSERLELPHPRLAERAFVLAPLAAIDPALLPPLPGEPPQGCGDRLEALLALGQETPPRRLPPQSGWPE